jgi:hypothetical protein
MSRKLAREQVAVTTGCSVLQAKSWVTEASTGHGAKEPFSANSYSCLQHARCHLALGGNAEKVGLLLIKNILLANTSIENSI